MVIQYLLLIALHVFYKKYHHISPLFICWWPSFVFTQQKRAAPKARIKMVAAARTAITSLICNSNCPIFVFCSLFT